MQTISLKVMNMLLKFIKKIELYKLEEMAFRFLNNKLCSFALWNAKFLNYCWTWSGLRDEMQWCPYNWRSVNKKDTSRSSLPHHHRGRWNETKWVRGVYRNGGMKFVAQENVRNPEKNLLRLLFIHHKIYMEWLRLELKSPRGWEVSDLTAGALELAITEYTERLKLL